MKTKGLFFSLVAGTLLLLSSCGKDEVFKQYKELPNQTWERIEDGKKLTFDNIEITKENESYDIVVMLRHTPYINEDQVKFKMLITSPSGTTRESVHQIKLKDRDNKGWRGDALGDLIDIEEVCKQYVTFSEKGLYTIELVNMGTKYETVGLLEVGLKVVKSDLNIKTK